MKRKSYEIKKSILLFIKEGSLSYAELERKVNTCYITIKNSCEELEKWGHVKIKKIDEHPANGKPSYLVILTKNGTEFIERENKN